LRVTAVLTSRELAKNTLNLAPITDFAWLNGVPIGTLTLLHGRIDNIDRGRNR
jgi:hypothetical protein